MPRDFRTLLKIALVSLTVSGCAAEDVQIRDHSVFGDKGKFGATEVHTLKTTIPPVLWNKAEWDARRIGMVCIDASDLTEIQEAIDVLCTKYKHCVYDSAYVKRFLSFMARVRQEVRE